MERYYSYTKLTDGIYRILADGKNCCELIVGTQKAALLDTGLGFCDLPGIVREITDLPLLILNTHSHIDHAGGNALFNQPAYMGQEDIETFDYAAGRDMRIITVNRFRPLVERLKEQENLDEDAYINIPAQGLIPIFEGDVFDLGGFTLRVFNTPGHSTGGRSFYLEEKKFLYTGDAVYPCTYVFGFGSASRDVHIETLKKILSIPFDLVYGNHRAKPMTRENIELYLKAAQTVKYEDGYPFPNPIKDGEDARSCLLEGFKPGEDEKEGFGGLVLSSYNA